MSTILESHMEIWKKRYILRYVYQKWYQKIIADLAPGEKTLELGAGSGNFKEYKPDVISSDIDPKPWLDMVFDAHHMPFKDGEVSNIVMIDVLHHLDNPVKFCEEASRVLKKGGRVLIIEPYMSFFSYPAYKMFHAEPVEMGVDYFSKETITEKDPWDSNQAIAKLLFYKNEDKFNRRFSKKLKIVKKERSDFVIYPLSGGFEKRQLMPDFLIPVFNVFEFLMKPFAALFAFRCYVVLEKI